MQQFSFLAAVCYFIDKNYPIMFNRQLKTWNTESNHSLFFEGKCVNRHGMFPTTKCSRYLNCGEDGRANIMDCNIAKPGTIFNISSRQCDQDTTPPCEGKYSSALRFVICLVQATLRQTRKISMTNFYTKYDQGNNIPDRLNDSLSFDFNSNTSFLSFNVPVLSLLTKPNNNKPFLITL